MRVFISLMSIQYIFRAFRVETFYFFAYGLYLVHTADIYWILRKCWS